MIGNPSYPTYQVFLAIGVAGIITIVLMPLFIRLMKREGVGQQIRADGPQRHLTKQGTPTMGGLIILLSVLATCAILADWTPQLILAVVATMLTGALGLLDDIESVAHARSLGLTQTQTMRLVIIPQGLRKIAPALMNDFIAMQKDVGLISTLGAVDAVRAAQIVVAKTYNFTPYVVASILFILMSVPFILLNDWYSEKLRKREQTGGMV